MGSINFPYYLCMFLAALLLLPIKLTGQSDFSGFTINPLAGVWVGNSWKSEYRSDGANPSAGIQASIIRGERAYGIKYQFGQNFCLLSCGPTYEINQLELNYGMYRTGSIGRLKLIGGLNYSWGLYDVYENETYTLKKYGAPGISLQAGMDLHLIHWMSWGILIQGYVNTHGYGILPMLSIEFGKIRVPYTN